MRRFNGGTEIREVVLMQARKVIEVSACILFESEPILSTKNVCPYGETWCNCCIILRQLCTNQNILRSK